MSRAKIFFLCVFAAMTYGVLHDQVTARLCIEYFTVAHPPIFSATSPTIVALCWGIAATVGIGAVLGSLLALISHAGSEPPLQAGSLFRPISRLLGVMALAAFTAGVCGYFLAVRGVISIPPAFGDLIPHERHNRFMAAWFAHGASYLIGLVGGTHLVIRVWKERGRPVVISILPRTPGAVARALVVAVIAAYVVWNRFSSR